MKQNNLSAMAKAKNFAGRAVFTMSATGAWLASAGFNALTGASMGTDMLSMGLWITAAVSLDMLKAGAAVKVASSQMPFLKRIAAVSLLAVATSVSL